MAHAARIDEITSDLVSSLSSHAIGSSIHSRLRERAVKGFKNASHSRTNQFDVHSKLQGLSEKFGVLGREDLEDALQLRLDRLPNSKWTPEVLSLLLQLSDRPLEKTKLEDVEGLVTESAVFEPVLTWGDILGDDPLDEAGIWDDVEHGYHSSGDEAADRDATSDDTISTQATSVGEEDLTALARLEVVQLGDEGLDEIREAHDRLRSSQGDGNVSELLLIRETLSMLHGLPTILFKRQANGQVICSSKIVLATASQPVIMNMLKELAALASSLDFLREWIKSRETIVCLQACQASSQQHLMKFDSSLALIEQKYLQPAYNTPVSLLDLRTEVAALVKPLVHLSELIRRSTQASHNSHLTLLDALYDATCIAQMSGDAALFEIFVSIFAAGMKAYSRPLAHWIRTGAVNHDDKSFFVAQTDIDIDHDRLWQDQFTIKTLNNGKPAAPASLQAYIGQVFSLGKSRAFLRRLSGRNDDELDTVSYCVPNLNLLGRDTKVDNLLPFSQALDDELESWLGDMGKDCTPLLCRSLLNEHGLLRAIGGLGHVFFSQNSRLFQTFADAVFWSMDRGTQSWQDSFMLTELARSTLGNYADVAAEDLTVYFNETQKTDVSETSIQQIQGFELSYHFSWPIQNVTRCASPSTCTKALAFLLQVYRAKYLLRQQLFDLRTIQSRTEDLPKAARTSLKTRQMLVSTVDALHEHITSAAYVINTKLCRDIEAAEDIDAMAAIWREAQSELETALLIAERLRPIREAITTLLVICEQFTVGFTSLLESKKATDDDVAGSLGRKTLQHPKLLSQTDLASLQAQVAESLSFIIAGLRGISRVGGNVEIDLLTERLQWSVH